MILALLPKDEERHAVWPREMFHATDLPNAPCPAELDVTGRKRILLFGPYARLGPGRWQASVRFELDEHAARRPYRLEFIVGDAMTYLEVQPTGPGEYQVQLDTLAPNAGFAEVRISLMRAAFHGTLRFLQAEVERLD